MPVMLSGLPLNDGVDSNLCICSSAVQVDDRRRGGFKKESRVGIASLHLDQEAELFRFLS